MKNLRQHSEAYLEVMRRRGYSEKSLALYQRILGDFADQCRAAGEVTSIMVRDLEGYRLGLVERKFSPASLDAYLRTVRRFFTWLTEEQVLFENPALGLAIPRPPRKLLPVPTQEDMARLLAAIETDRAGGVRDRALIETAYATGVRRAELIGLRIRDVNLDRRTLRVLGKGRKERVVPSGRNAADWLGRYLKEARPQLAADGEAGDALWISRFAQPLTYHGLNEVLKRLTHKAGLRPFGHHAIRRACATHMLQAGAHPSQIQLLLGHSGLKTLSQYLRVSITELQQAHARQNPGK